LDQIVINETLVQKIYDILKEKIVNLELKLGQRIDIKEIVKKYGVSQTPIRDSLNRLIKDGLVEYKPRRGYYVVNIKYKDMAEIYDLRIMMESYALREGISNINIKKLENLLKEARQLAKEPVRSYKPEMFIHIDRELHLLIIHSADNERLRNLYLHIYPFVEISQDLDPSYSRSNNEHIALMESILNRNVQKSLDILNQHINNCKKSGIKMLQNGFNNDDIS
jgi:DNA-binding GntR family transcriptional regulator